MQGFATGHTVLGYANKRTTKDVDHGDNHAGDTVTFNELHSAVHGAVHLAFLAYVATSDLRFFHVNDACTHVGVNRHLLTRHSVEGEAGANFSNTFSTFCNNKELYDGDDKEDNRTNNKVTTKGELTENIDDFASVCL